MAGSGSILFLTGKGGSGKSLLARRLAEVAADAGLPTTLVRLHADTSDSPTNGSDRTNADRADGPNKPGGPDRLGFQTTVLDQRTALREFLTSLISFGFVADRLLQSSTFRAVADVAPGLSDLATLDALRKASGKAPSSLTIVDGPPTGQAVALLTSPQQAPSIIDTGTVATVATRLTHFVASNSFRIVVPVPLEELPVEEAIELQTRLNEAGLTISATLANEWFPPRFDEESLQWLRKTGVSPDALHYQSKVDAQQRQHARLDGLGVPCLNYPFEFDGRPDSGALRRILAALLPEARLAGGEEERENIGSGERVAGERDAGERNAGEHDAGEPVHQRSGNDQTVAATSGGAGDNKTRGEQLATGPAWLSSPLVVFVGEGGVGKTSLAAATALHAARQGARVAVLTVDPAPRLAEALGVKALGDSPVQVDLDAFAAEELAPEESEPEDSAPTDETGSPDRTRNSAGSLDAMRLDVRSAFDRLVRQSAPSAAAAEELLANPIYRAVAGGLGGSEHYMTFRRLHELSSRGYDQIILDTPPAVHVADLLSAPRRLGNLIDTSALSVVADPGIILARAGSAVIRSGLTVLLSVLSRFLGSELERRISEFAEGFSFLLDTLGSDTEEVSGMLQSDDSAFVMVCGPHRSGTDTAMRMWSGFRERGITCRQIVINRLVPGHAPPYSDEDPKRFDLAPAGCGQAAARAEEDLSRLRRMQQETIRCLHRESRNTPHFPPLIAIPELDPGLPRRPQLTALAQALAARGG